MKFSEFITESKEFNELFMDKLLKKFVDEFKRSNKELKPKVSITKKSIGEGDIFNFRIDLDIKINPDKETFQKISDDAESNPARKGGSWGSAAGIVGDMIEERIEQSFLKVAGVRIAWITTSQNPRYVTGYLTSNPVTKDGFSIEANKLVRK